MSAIYTYSKARQNLAMVLEAAIRDGEVRIRCKDGRIFVIVPEQSGRSPLDIEGIDLGLTREEIVEFIHEGRKYR